MSFGLCCGSGFSCALLCGALLLGGAGWSGSVGDVAAAVGAQTGCAKVATAGDGCDKIARKITGLVGFDNNCARFSACSVDRNLMLASGEELERYEQEVALDGKPLEGFFAPDFRLPTTAGSEVTLSGLRGKNVALVLLSGHCSHSVDTLPILTSLKNKYAASNLEIVPVFVNSGDVETLASRAWEWRVEYPLAVSETKDISKDYDARMVPSTFLIDEDGRVTRKLVGFKDEATLDRTLAALIVP